MKATPTILSPSEFAYFQLGMTGLYDWQIEGLESIGLQEEGGKPTSVVAANGSGKTSNLVAPAVLWFLSKYPRGQVIITSGSFRQVEKQLWPAMRVFSSRFPKWSFLQTEIKTPDGGFALGFSTDDPGRAEGWHPKQGRETDPVFIIVDEAKTVPNAIFEAFDRCTRVFQLWVSSPGKPAGQFYESFHADKKYFHTLTVPSRDCPHIDPAKRKRDREKYGIESAIYRSMHEAEFTEDEESLVLTSPQLKEAIEYQPKPSLKGEKCAFFDFAAGRDENSFGLRMGNVVELVEAWVQSDTVQAVRKFIRMAKERGLSAGECWGDADGLGKPMIDQFHEEGFFINAFHGGMAAMDSDNYANMISETWFHGARAINRGKYHFLSGGEEGLDPLTFKQLTTRNTEWTEQGKLRIMSKEKMRKNGQKSPDRADAILGCIYCGAHLSGVITGDVVDNSSVPTGYFSHQRVVF